MQPIDSFDLRLFDMNLLVSFDALMSERSVTKAAERMRVGQPAMSHALASLRVLLQDELLVRTGNVMEPTARALQVHEEVVRGLSALQSAVRLPHAFDPMTEERTFRLGFSSDVELLLMPRLTARMSEQAPGIRLVGRLVDGAHVPRLLDEGALDLAVGCFRSRAARFYEAVLFEQALRCVWNPHLLDLPVPLTVERYSSVPHVVVTLDDNLRGCLDAALTAAKIDLNIVAASSQFLSVLASAAGGPVLATLPAGVAALYAERFDLRQAPPPLDLALPPIAMAWSARSHRDPGSEWLRGQVTELMASIVPVEAWRA